MDPLTLAIIFAALGGGGGAIFANNANVSDEDKWKYALGGALGGGTLGFGAGAMLGGGAAVGTGAVGTGLAAEGIGLGGGAAATGAGAGGGGLAGAFAAQQAAEFGALAPVAFGSGTYGLGMGAGGAGLGATYLGGQAVAPAGGSLMSSFLKNTAASIASQKAMDTMKGNYQSQVPIMEKDFRNTLEQYKKQEEERNKLPPYYFTYPNMQQNYGGF